MSVRHNDYYPPPSTLPAPFSHDFVWWQHPTKAICPILLEDYRKITVERKGSNRNAISEITIRKSCWSVFVLSVLVVMVVVVVVSVASVALGILQ